MDSIGSASLQDDTCDLSRPIALHRVHVHALHEVVVLGDFGFGEVQVHLHALFEQFRCLGGVAEHELAHHAVGGELVQVAAAEVGELVVVSRLHIFHGFVELRVHGLSAGLEALVFGGHFARFQFLEHLAVGSGVDVREGGNRLQLRRAFVNGGDACVAVEALAGVFEHVAGTAVYLDAVVGVQVGVFGVHALGERRACAGELLVELEFSLLFVGELTGALDVFEALVDIYIAGCLVQECAACVEASLDVRNHFVHSREVHNGLAELLAVLGVGESFVVCHLADAHGLCCNAEAGAVHEGHHVLDEAELAAATEFSLRVLVDKFAGRASVDAELVLDAAHVHASVFLRPLGSIARRTDGFASLSLTRLVNTSRFVLTVVVDEHGKAAAVVGAFFGAGEHQVDVAVAVRDEALHAVQVPALVGFAVGGLEHHALQVGTGIGFGQVHGHRLAGAHARDKAGTLVLVAEFIQGLDAVLQGPDVLETGVRRGDHFVDGRVGGNREVESAEAARHGHAIEAGLAGGFQVLVGLGCVADAAVFAVGAFGVHVFGVREDGVRGDVACDFEHAVVAVYRVGVVFRRVVKAVLVGVAVFLELHDALHQGRTFKVELNLWMVCVKIRHNAYLLFAL